MSALLEDADETLVEIVKTGESPRASIAFATLLRRHDSLIRQGINRRVWLTRYGCDHEDLFQIIALTLYRTIPSYRHIEGKSFVRFLQSLVKYTILRCWQFVKKGRQQFQEISGAVTLALQPDSYTFHEYEGMSPSRTMFFPDIEKLFPRPRVSAVAYVKRENRTDPYMRPVRRLDTRKVYASVYDAAKDNSHSARGYNRRMTAGNASKFAIVNAVKYGTKCVGTKWEWAT